eukprot:scaffold54906_cov69-Phaeocystis_antarctica.AAC.5
MPSYGRSLSGAQRVGAHSVLPAYSWQPALRSTCRHSRTPELCLRRLRHMSLISLAGRPLEDHAPHHLISIDITSQNPRGQRATAGWPSATPKRLRPHVALATHSSEGNQIGTRSRVCARRERAHPHSRSPSQA